MSERIVAECAGLCQSKAQSFAGAAMEAVTAFEPQNDTVTRELQSAMPLNHCGCRLKSAIPLAQAVDSAKSRPRGFANKVVKGC